MPLSMPARAAFRRSRRDIFFAFFMVGVVRFIILDSHARLAASRACSTRGNSSSLVFVRAESTAGAIRSAVRSAASDAADLK
jgi:hypothetical protein